MNKRILLALFVMSISILLCAQTTTNNNTVIINGDVYYFMPSTQASSPMPRVGNSGFIGYGRWYGADAARAWASIVDWAIEHCESAGYAVRARNGERVYISSVEAKKVMSQANTHRGNEIEIYYWIVNRGDRMEDGYRRTRSFFF
jgi:hypothetical protein